MLYVRGDIHGDIDDLFESARRLNDDECTKNDVLIICGDFGFLWWDNYNSTKVVPENPDFFLDKQEKQLDRIEKEFPATVVFVDGNHENMPLINSYPLVQWNGGLAHMIRPHIYHLCRGQIFTIEGLKFFCLGGNYSHDIRDGIVDPDLFENNDDFISHLTNLDKDFKQYRIKNIDWWKDEVPSMKERQQAIANLAKNDNKVDFIITHAFPTTVRIHLFRTYLKSDKNEYEDWLEKFIYAKVNFKRWFAGHYHVNRILNGNCIALYNRVERIN